MQQPLALSVDFGQGFTDAFSRVISFIPKLLAFLAVLLIGWFVAKVIARVLTKLLNRAGFPRLAERSGVAGFLEGSSYDATGLLVKVVYYAIMLVILQLALGVFGPNPVSDLLNRLIAWIPKAIVALVIIVVAMAIARAVRDIISNALSSTSYGRTVATVAWAFIVALGAIAALGQAEIATSITGPLLTAVLAAIAGILIVGVGGGLVFPMRERWERWLSAAERETAESRRGGGAGGAGAGAGAGAESGKQP